ncbi:MAG: YbaB/EbfC family nucleoid-associated protein [Planctomycetota bacterium]
MAKGFDPSEIMNQARKVKDQMAKTQESLKEKIVEAEAGGGLIKVFVNGGNEVVGIKINKDAVDLEDLGMLEDLVMVAVNNGIEKATEMSNEEMNKITGGLGLGGMF